MRERERERGMAGWSDGGMEEKEREGGKSMSGVEGAEMSTARGRRRKDMDRRKTGGVDSNFNVKRLLSYLSQSGQITNAGLTGSPCWSRYTPPRQCARRPGPALDALVIALVASADANPPHVCAVLLAALRSAPQCAWRNSSHYVALHSSS